MAARKAFFTPRLDRDLPEVPAEKSSTAVLPRPQTNVQLARDVIETRKADKALPDLPISRIPSQIRNGVSFAGQPVWAPAARQLPTTIIEEREPSPEKKNIPVQRQIPLRPKDNNIILQVANNEGGGVTGDVKPTNPGHGSKPEPLPETWKHVIGTPSSFKKALDDVVRKLEDMEDKDKKPVADVEKAPSRRGSSKVPSPSQRLQRAAAMRRERLGGPSGQRAEPVAEKLKAPVQTPARNPRPSEGPRSNHRKPAVKLRGGGGEESTLAGGSSAQVPPPTHDDKDISDKDVLQGLKIICAASADHNFDAWIQSKTGLRLRRFLADLKTFENLTEDGILAMGDQRAARRRRSERRKRQVEGNGSVKGSSSRTGSVRRQPGF